MTWLVLAYAIAEWVIRIVMIFVILRRRLVPGTALAWLTLIFFLPVVGLVIYLMVGVHYLGRRRARWHEDVVGAARWPERLEEMKLHSKRPELLPEQRNMILQAEQISGNPIVGGNDMELIGTNDELLERLLEDIENAKHHVHLLFYIYFPDEVGTQVSEALIRAVKRGVRCRVLADEAGSRPLFRSKLALRMRQAGVELYPALPVRLWRRKLARIDLRNHRKIAVVDGEVAYTGSHNIVVETYGPKKRAGKWVDLSGRFQGPVVSQLQMVFLDDWLYETGEHLKGADLFPSFKTAGHIPLQVVPTGPNHEAETFHRVLVGALNVASRKIIITTPYLVPDEPTMLALSMAADRGVEISIVVPEKSDHPVVAAAGRWYYEQLMEAGIQIYRYQGGMLHAKTITVDDAFGLLGSANIDVRSFRLNFEINVLLYGAEVTAHLRWAQRRYLSQCYQIDPEQWRRRGRGRQYVESGAALLSPLL